MSQDSASFAVTTRSGASHRVLWRRAPKRWCLSKVETINSFENWKQNLLYTLSLDSNFAPFLADGVTWLKKKNRAQPLRGLESDGEAVPLSRRLSARQKANFLELMLGQTKVIMSGTVFGSDRSVDFSPSIAKIYQTLKTVFCHIFSTFKFVKKKYAALLILNIFSVLRNVVTHGLKCLIINQIGIRKIIFSNSEKRVENMMRSEKLLTSLNADKLLSYFKLMRYLDIFCCFQDSITIQSKRIPIYTYEDMIDHRNYTHNLSSCEIKA